MVVFPLTKLQSVVTTQLIALKNMPKHFTAAYLNHYTAIMI